MGEAKRRLEANGGEPLKPRGRPERWSISGPNRYRLDPEKVSEARAERKAGPSKRQKAKARRIWKKTLNLTRRDVGAIGAGHMPKPDGA